MSSNGVVLVGIDGSEVADAVLKFAAREAHRRGARLVVAHAGSREPVLPGERPASEIICSEAVATVAAMYPRLESDVVQRDAAPATLLNELSETADLLVVGTHRTGRMRGWLLGSVSQSVAAHAACPVVTISGPPGHVEGPIVLGVSPSSGGLAALRFACERAGLSDTPVHAIRSITVEDVAMSGPRNAVMFGADVLHDAARTALDLVLTEAKRSYPDVSISGVVGSTTPFNDLMKASSEASMLVIGSRRSGTSMLPHLGPVAAWLLHQATCPLAVVGYREV